jgi:hypothetical protein
MKSFAKKQDDVSIDIRLIAGTNHDLRREAYEGLSAEFCRMARMRACDSGDFPFGDLTLMTAALGVPASPWNAALQFEDPLHTAMPKIHRLAIHHRAASDQTVDVVPLALSYGLFGYAPLPEGPVQPYVADSKVCAFPGDLCGHVRVSHDHHSFDRFRD